MSKHMTIINLACTITKLRKWGEAWKHSAESAQAATARMHQAHEAKMVEHRAAFGARTEADRKIIAGLREESAKCQAELDDLYQREGIEKKRRMDVEDERDALRAEVAALERLRASIARWDFAQMEIAALKSQTPKQHPVKVGEWVRRSKLPGDQSPVGIVKQVTSIRCDGDSYGFADGDFWSVDNCEPCSRQHPAQDGQWVRRTVASGTEPVGTMIQVQRSRTLHSEYVTRGAQVVPWAHCEPCDPPATHDTEAGKAVAESALKTEPVAEEIKVDDLVEVVSATHRIYTEHEDLGRRGIVTAVDGMRLSVEAVPGYQLPISGIVGKCDVRKVTT